jgi:hypothetical protein
MTQSQIFDFEVTGGPVLELFAGVKYQILIDSFGYAVIVNTKTGNYLPVSLKEVE